MTRADSVSLEQHAKDKSGHHRLDDKSASESIVLSSPVAWRARFWDCRFSMVTLASAYEWYFQIYIPTTWWHPLSPTVRSLPPRRSWTRFSFSPRGGPAGPLSARTQWTMLKQRGWNEEEGGGWREEARGWIVVVELSPTGGGQLKRK